MGVVAIAACLIAGQSRVATADASGPTTRDNPTSLSGNGYLVVAGNGAIRAFGDAVSHGGLGAKRLNAPIATMAMTPSGAGYWMVGTDGAIFAFGDAHFFGSAVGMFGTHPVVAMSPD